ncbi:MAG: glycosyltransferase family 1 protein, partial [Clostridia bacterium]|nr:glycosyltransferase family 1 protein [Clostridia bacterium]
MGTSDSPLRVLHCLFGLAPGGVETWLLNLTRAKPENVQFDFLIRRAGGAYENEIKALGANVYL